jgi:hypothetical protein
VTDQFKVLKHGNVAGSVYRLLAEEPVPLYESPVKNANIMRRVTPGSLVVVFSDPGELRQINTSDQTFGYIARSVKLVPVAGIDPDGVYDPEKRAAIEATLPPMDEMGAAHATKVSVDRRNQHLFVIGLIFLALLGIVTMFLVSPAAKPK